MTVLSGLTVIDCSQLIAGPMIGMILGDFGADVLKIEHPKGGDPLRTFGKKRGDAPLYWKFLSRNKQSVNLALNTAPGQDLFIRLIAETKPDVMIESFRPGTLERWGLGYERLRDLHPGLILVRVSGFGQTGPYRDRPGFGTLAEAMSGFAHMTGEADGPPTLPPIPLADSVAALYGTVGTLLALRVRDASEERRGQVVDASLLESLFSLMGNQLLEFDQLGLVAQRDGNRAPTSAPRNLYPTADGRWIAVAAPTKNVVERLFRLIGRPELLDDSRYATNSARLDNVAALDEIVTAWTSVLSREDALVALIAAEVPAAPVADMADLADDPHLVARGAVVAVDDPELGRLRMPGVLPGLSETPGSIRRHAPSQGSANEAIYRDRLGLTEIELAELRNSDVI